MKIVCDACQAKYSISDDKISGKAFKIRCKKCSAVIVVRGATAAAAPEPALSTNTRVYDDGHSSAPAADDAVWHVVIDQDQVGPLTAAELGERVASGTITGETFTWREGMADWLPLADIETFAALVSGGAAAAATGDSTAVSSMVGAFAAKPDHDDVFAAASKPRTRATDDGGELFAASSASGDAQAAAGSKLRGERNESSVLFSLNNLSQLADTPRRAAAPVGAAAGGHASGAATGEGSGLIDIRSMANAYMGGGGGGAAVARPASSVGSIDDLPVFGGGGFVESAVIVPTARSASNSRLLYMMIAAVALLAVIAIVLVVLLVGGDKPAAEAKAPTAEPAAVAQAPVAKPADEVPVAVAPPPPAPVATPAQTPAPPREKAPARSDAKRPARVSSQNSERPAAPRAAATPPTETGGCEEVSCVINGYEGACCAKFRRGPKPAGPGTPKTDAPASLDKQMISTGIANVKARVMTCGDKSPAKGKVTVKVAVAGSGSVKSVTVESTPDAALGACVAAAVQRASFAPTQSGGSFRVPYTF